MTISLFKNGSFLTCIIFAVVAGSLIGCGSSSAEPEPPVEIKTSDGTVDAVDEEASNSVPGQEGDNDQPTTSAHAASATGSGLYDELETGNERSNLPAEAEAVLRKAMDEKFLKLENGDFVTRIDDFDFRWEISGTETHTSGNLVVGYLEGLQFHQLGYQVAKRKIGFAAKLDRIDEHYDIVFTAPAVANLGNLSHPDFEIARSEKAFAGYFRNTANSSDVFPGVSVIRVDGKWRVLRQRWFDSFSSKFDPSDIEELNDR